MVYYNHAADGCYFNIHSTKTKAGERKIPMLESVKEAFKKEKEYQEYNNLQHQGTLNKALKRIIRDCNDMQLLKKKKNPVLLPNFSCHSLRHTFTTSIIHAN